MLLGNFLSSRFQSNKENTDVDNDVNSSPYLSSFAKRLSTLQAAPLDAGMDKYRKMEDPPRSSSYRPSSSHYQQQTKQVVRPQNRQENSLTGSFVQMVKAFDRQYNASAYIYVGLIMLVGIGILVIIFH